MKFELTVQVELPFVLNIDSRSFSVVVASGRSIDLEVDNDAHLVRFENPRSPQGFGMLIGSLADLAAKLKIDTGRLPAAKLRTVVRSSVEREVEAAALPEITDAELPTLVMSALVKAGTETTPEALRSEADRLLEQMLPVQKEAFRLGERQRRFGQHELVQLQDDYLSALNRLIRWYSVDCADFFVEEVGLHQLAATTTRGILRMIVVDGRLIPRGSDQKRPNAITSKPANEPS